MAFSVIAGFFIVAIVGGVGLGVASADSIDDVARAGAFGFDAATHQATSVSRESVAPVTRSESTYYEQSVLASSAPRDVSSGIQMIDDMERAEQEAALQRMVAEKAMQGVETSAEVANGEAPAPELREYNLTAVDWSVGKEAFVAEWTARIDAYLANSTLEGYGWVFAEAAWDNGVDPRWSPAISNTESGKGYICFLPCNAWGWGSSSWGDWETAIRSHVEGLASGYGYSITVDAAQTYCPPNWENWYNDTLDQMSSI